MDQNLENLKAGECVWCRIEAPEPGGYLVSVVSSELKGFLPAMDPIELGRVVPTTLVCFDGNRALFTFAFTMGTSARVQHSKESEEENAFAVWADAHPKSIAPRRAVDLVMPPLDSVPILIKLDEKKAREVFPKIEETHFTGCLKVYCQSSLSRAALIFLDGRAVGSVYTKKPMPYPYPIAIGIKKMLEDVSAPDADADLEMYDLPREIVLSMSSLFLGYVDGTVKNDDRNQYAEKMLAHFLASKATGCFHLLDEKSETPLALGFVYEGEFKGSYVIGERLYSKDREFLFQLIEQHAEMTLKAHILPAAMTTDAVRFGFRLSSEQFTV